jgi:hypothetical protein
MMNFKSAALTTRPDSRFGCAGVGAAAVRSGLCDLLGDRKNLFLKTFAHGLKSDFGNRKKV